MIDEMSQRIPHNRAGGSIRAFEATPESSQHSPRGRGPVAKRDGGRTDANLLVVIKDMRDAARAADESNDPGTVDLFSKTVHIHEKCEWFFREVLKRRPAP